MRRQTDTEPVGEVDTALLDAELFIKYGSPDRALRMLVDDAGLQAARLKLAGAARQVLANALDTVGVVAPNSM